MLFLSKAPGNLQKQDEFPTQIMDDQLVGDQQNTAKMGSDGFFLKQELSVFEEEQIKHSRDLSGSFPFSPNLMLTLMWI